MRQTIALVIVAAIASSLLTAYAKNRPAPPPPPHHPDTAVSTAPDSLLGHKVHVFFRGVDDMPFPSTGSGVTLAMKVTYLEGTIIDNKPGWIELENKGEALVPHAWIPLSSVAYIATATGADAPTTQPQ